MVRRGNRNSLDFYLETPVACLPVCYQYLSKLLRLCLMRYRPSLQAGVTVSLLSLSVLRTYCVHKNTQRKWVDG